MVADDIKLEIGSFTLELVKYSLCDEQNMPSIKVSKYGGIKSIAISGNTSYSAAMKNINYSDAYEEIESSNSYNLKMIDGGLIQLLYTISAGNELISHRLAFFSSPSHETYQNEPEIYEDDLLYADFLKKNIVPFPIRFDYNSDVDKHIDVDHPKSHLTLGQYEACRIPLTSPIGPGSFIKFIMQNFYNRAYKKHSEISELDCMTFSNTITDSECKVMHVNTGNTE